MLGMHYLTPRSMAAAAGNLQQRLLGVVYFGAWPSDNRSALAADCSVDLAGLTGEPVAEVWSSCTATQREDTAAIRGASDGTLIFGSLQRALDGDIASVAENAYADIFDYIDARGYSHLLRVWNYFPGINAEDGALERYRRFSIGRHAAFAARAGDAPLPAASALGTQSGPLTIYFIAGRTPGLAIENPRQMSAYHYPTDYGPRSPLFSRAMVGVGDTARPLFISGTASIVGHETRHAQDVSAQTTELLVNINALIEAAPDERPAPPGAGWRLKAYIRNPADLPMVRDGLEAAVSPEAEIVYLQADICRRELLVEVEAVRLSTIDRAAPAAAGA